MNGTYTFPSAEVVYNKLADASITTPASDVKRVFEQFAGAIGESRKNASGVNLRWSLALHDVSSRPGASPVMVFNLIDMQFSDLMTALIDDPAFLEEVLAVRAEIDNY